MVKKIIITFALYACLGVTTIATCQNKCDTTNIVFSSPEKLPEFDINRFIEKNLKYPKMAIKDKVEGRVVVRFWIDTKGYTSEHEIVKGIRKDLNEEALRVAKLIRFDKPAMNKGEPVGMCYQITFSFRLSDKNKKTFFQRLTKKCKDFTN